MQFERVLSQPGFLFDEQNRQYSLLDSGYVSFSDISEYFFPTGDIKYRRWEITGEVEGYPALGRGLRFSEVENKRYHDKIGIHPDDVSEYVRRHAAWDAYNQGFVQDESGVAVQLGEVAIQTLRSYLEDIGAIGTGLHR